MSDTESPPSARANMWTPGAYFFGPNSQPSFGFPPDTSTVTCAVSDIARLDDLGDSPSITMIANGVRAFRENEHDGRVDDVVTAVIEIWRAMEAARDGEA